MNDKTIANTRQTRITESGRIPMSLPILKLAVPDIPGYHTHWMRGDAARIHQARKAGYEFVENDEVDMANMDLAGGDDVSGNTDLGTRVSISAGSEIGKDGQPERLILMKIRQEWWEADQAILGDKQEELAATMRGEGVGGESYIPEHAKKTVSTMFTRKR